MNLLGKMASFIPFSMLDKDGNNRIYSNGRVTGRITYVNEEHKYFLVTCEVNGEILRESFKFSQIGEDVKVRGR